MEQIDDKFVSVFSDLEAQLKVALGLISEKSIAAGKESDVMKAVGHSHVIQDIVMQETKGKAEIATIATMLFLRSLIMNLFEQIKSFEQGQ